MAPFHSHVFLFLRYTVCEWGPRRVGPSPRLARCAREVGREAGGHPTVSGGGRTGTAPARGPAAVPRRTNHRPWWRTWRWASASIADTSPVCRHPPNTRHGRGRDGRAPTEPLLIVRGARGGRAAAAAAGCGRAAPECGRRPVTIAPARAVRRAAIATEGRGRGEKKEEKNKKSAPEKDPTIASHAPPPPPPAHLPSVAPNGRPRRPAQRGDRHGVGPTRLRLPPPPPGRSVPAAAAEARARGGGERREL